MLYGWFDIQHPSRKLENVVRFLSSLSDVCRENKQKILEFQAWLSDDYDYYSSM